MEKEITIVIKYDKEESLKCALKGIYGSVFGIRDALVRCGVVKDVEIKNADEEILFIVNKAIYGRQ